MSTTNKFYKLLAVMLCVSTLSFAQVSTLEMVSGTPNNGAYNLPVTGYNFGPTTANHVVTFAEDAANNSHFTAYNPSPGGPVTATFAFSAQNYTGFSYGPGGNNITTGLVFGAGPSLSTGGTVQQVSPFNSFDFMNAFYGDGIGPNNPMFTSNLGIPTNGVDGDGSAFGNDINSGVEVFTVAQRQFDLGTPFGTANRYNYGTLTITFSRYVKDPVIHLAGLGGSYRYLPTGQPDIPANYRSTFFSTELELVGPGTLSILSGNPNLAISGKNILNSATIPNGGSQANAGNFNNFGAASGSVKITGTFNSITLRVWLRGCDASQFGWSSNGIGVVTNATRSPLTGDVWMISASFEKQQLITLPSTGVNLTAALNGNDVSLNWKTLTEINSKEFQIERSTDGVNFVAIGSKPAAGNSATQIDYTAVDPNMNVNVYYYRLKLVDLDGNYKYSNIAIVKKAGGIKGVRAFPNPAVSNISLEFSNLKGGLYNVTLYNQAGQQVYNKQVTIQQAVQYVPVERGSLAPGSYLVSVKNANADEKYVQNVIFQ